MDERALIDGLTYEQCGPLEFEILLREIARLRAGRENSQEINNNGAREIERLTDALEWCEAEAQKGAYGCPHCDLICWKTAEMLPDDDSNAVSAEACTCGSALYDTGIALHTKNCPLYGTNP